jgi:hypothetical protein
VSAAKVPSLQDTLERTTHNVVIVIVYVCSRSSARAGHHEVLFFLLSREWDVSSRVFEDVFLGAVATMRLPAVQQLYELLRGRFDIYCQEADALRIAATEGHYEVVRWLVEEHGFAELPYSPARVCYTPVEHALMAKRRKGARLHLLS